MRMNNLESEESRHEREFNARPTWNAFEASEKAKKNRENEHEDSKCRRRQNARDEVSDHVRELAYPREPCIRFAQLVNIADRADKSNREGPEDD